MNRAIAFMSLNGSLDDAELIPYLDELCRAGYTGACLHPRDGLQIPYLSRAFWRRYERIIELCKERNLEVWLYDEFPYPSGAAGGSIPELYPAARVRTLRFAEVESAPLANGMLDLGAGPLLALLRYTPGPGETMTNVQDVTCDIGPHYDTWVWGEWTNRYYTGAQHVRVEPHERGTASRFTWAYQPETPLGEDRLLAIRLETVPGKKAWAGMPDITLPEVTDLFLDKVYRPLAAIAERQGLCYAPVFQDEVNFYCELPWNREIENRLRPVWGDRLYANLAALHKPQCENWETLRYQYRRACQGAIRDNWFMRVRDYCHAYNLKMLGHLAGEESIAGHWQFMGDLFENLALFDIPGYDIISSPTADDVNRCQAVGAKLAQSAGWVAGRKPMMAELFGAHGFHFDLQKARTELAWMAVHDIFHITDHSAWVNTLGPRKYDAPPVSNRFNPLASGYPDLWAWHDWFCDLMQEYRFDPKTLVLFPTASLARYRLGDGGRWLNETSLLETFFHYVCALSLDVIFVPEDRLTEISLLDDGFSFQGQLFRKFIVPPVSSMREDTWEQLKTLMASPQSCWIGAEGDSQIAIFDGNYNDRVETIQAARIATISEAQLLADKADALAPLLESRLNDIRCDVSIVKSLRRHSNGDALLVLINPNEQAVTVTSPYPLGTPLPQLPHGVVIESTRSGDGFAVQFPARAVALFRQTPDSLCENAPQFEARELLPERATIRLVGPNHWNLKEGTSKLEGYETLPFLPQPISSQLEGDFPRKKAPYAPAFNPHPFPEPLTLETSFAVELIETLTELAVMIDEESLPPGTEVWWGETQLMPYKMDIYERGNTGFSIAPAQLAAGEHCLRFKSQLISGAQNILERPILLGRFLVEQAEPLKLKAMPVEAFDWRPSADWPTLGMPEGYGPVDYEVNFTLTQNEAGQRWQVQLPPCIGVAEVEVNGQAVGRSSWEPRRLPPGDILRAGENVMAIRLHGSWNNVFSRLNRLSNGLQGMPRLCSLPPQERILS